MSSVSLLELYKARYGQAVRRQGNGWNGPCPLCGGEPGKSDRFMVWPDRRESGGFSRGHLCREHDIPGAWYCRGCGQSGDAIAYLTRCEGMGMREALAGLGLATTGRGKGGVTRHRPAPVEPPASGSAASFAPMSWEPPPTLWREYATKLAAEGAAALPSQAEAVAWLERRGLTAAARARYGLGWLSGEGSRPFGRFRRRAALGLAPRVVDGREKTTLFIPRGISIPTFDAAGEVVAMRIRRPKADLAGDGRPAKYLALEGGCRAPFLLRSSLPPDLAVYFVVEAELDAMLIHHVSGGAVGALALRSNRTKPDAAAHAALRRAQRLCLALDYDDAGANALPWWFATYGDAARRWPVPEGKDPGDAVALGVDIREWVAAALPASVALPAPEPDARPGAPSLAPSPLPPSGVPADSSAGCVLEEGRGEREGVDFSPCAASGTDSEKSGAPGGGTGEAETYAGAWAREGGGLDGLPDGDREAVLAALPDYLTAADVPLAVGRAWLLWREVRGLRYVRECRDVYDRPGFGFAGECGGLPPWAQSLYDDLRALHGESRMLRAWLRDHRAAVVTAGNLFHIWD